ncbi:low specificity L-threonine aldolase [Sphingomonas histidinilytica]|uniref:threonine aldolase family protein n=1 Tax=Rhizorhabdus histidinilytica TaxID=439228 RepID=UPI001ADBED9F|nr:beta-eliminating lyase-related protein [Rhizorhabdus histidinilytica]MBO9375147.1 low specificity L-threonine aldolase [Rhizorhabdus histidinilytica]
MRERHDFFSDNTAGICPEALAAFAAANAGFVPSYGADRLTAQAADAVRALLDADAEVRFVSTGTVANAIACATLCPSAGAVLAYEQAHILIHEAGAPSFFGGGLEIEPLAGIDSRIEPAALDHALARPRGPHERRPAALSLTNATEYGTVYDEAMLARLCGPAKDAGLGIHLDGARLANAVAAGFDPRALTRAGIDIVVLGGSKAGAPFSEAIVLLDTSLARGFDERLTRSGQLTSKMRLLAAPWIGLLDGAGDDCPWIAHARHANAMARRLADGLPFARAYPVESNAVFVTMDGARESALAARGWRFARFEDRSARFVCSWATSKEAVDALIADARDIG